MERERKICPFCNHISIRKRQKHFDYYCERCRKAFQKPIIAILEEKIVSKVLEKKAWVINSQ